MPHQGAPNIAAIHPPTHPPSKASPPSMTARGHPTMVTQGRRWANPTEALSPRGRGSGLSAGALCPGSTERAMGWGRLPAPHQALPAWQGQRGQRQGRAMGGAGGCREDRCVPRRHMLLQGSHCVPPGWLEAIVNSNATALKMRPGQCQQCHHCLGDPGGTGLQGGSSMPGCTFLLGLQKSGPVLV